MAALLQVRGLSKSFGGLKAINDVDLDVEDKAIHGLIGPNGSGKSTFFNLVSCVYRAEAGEVHFDGRNITNIEPHEVAAAGIARTFQLLRMFTEMTVLENLMVGHHCHVGYSTFAGIFSVSRVAEEERQIRDEMMEILEFIGLSDFAGIPASELSVGQRRLLALGRAIAMKPKLLMAGRACGWTGAAECRKSNDHHDAAQGKIRIDRGRRRAHPEGRDGYVRYGVRAGPRGKDRDRNRQRR